jgi:N-acyl-D-aspartate/D-glutamate deacylase
VPFVVHQRSEADAILSSMEEVIEIGRKSGVKIHFSHFKVCGRKNWPLIDQGRRTCWTRPRQKGIRTPSTSIRTSPAAPCWA